uniref:Glycosyltransferase family 2 protein n=1 Tax=Moniliophthora roreri TaxID=221103 RepID=A0A0W0FZE0_MONRR
MKEHPQDIALHFQNGHRIQVNTLTVVLPIIEESVRDLPKILTSFLSADPRRILLLCPEFLAPEVERTLRIILSSDTELYPEYMVLPSTSASTLPEALLRASFSFTGGNDWILISDVEGLEGVDSYFRQSLLRPTSITVPMGPKGTLLKSKSLVSSNSCSTYPQVSEASYLTPPFIFHASLALQIERIPRTWHEFGIAISQHHPGGYGGIIWAKPKACHIRNESIPVLPQYSLDSTIIHDSQGIGRFEDYERESAVITFYAIFSTLDELRTFAPVLCRLQRDGKRVQNYLDTTYERSTSGNTLVGSCLLSYEPFFSFHGSVIGDRSIVLFTLAELGHRLEGATNIQIPRDDLLHCGWMVTLTAVEWRDWHLPRLTISIITKNRPDSLARLLSSVSRGRYFGDLVNMRIHLEQSTDHRTMQTVKSFAWHHGSLFIHHRVIHGGLLPAVVESWYPHTNDSYGLLLEDDVELSPLFYAWIKMSLLRYRYALHLALHVLYHLASTYRYGNNHGQHLQIFGISLYQQKNIELHTDGRKPFNASQLFIDNGIPPFTPYLSQIPCSWGAVYFPEHWAEFHDYLTMRFSEMAFPIDQVVVPEVRSNRWSKSWKKYFIELVFLRGYVMLYPNFPEFVSLSTNHLEVGSHVKVRSKAKQEAFMVPLMQLSSDSKAVVGLLSLPEMSLSVKLPVLNLTGSLSTIKDLEIVGASRRTELVTCEALRAFEAMSLLCLFEDQMVPAAYNP